MIDADKVTEADVTEAAKNPDIDAAIFKLQEIAGITDGGVAGDCFSGFDWTEASPQERAAQIAYWLNVETLYTEA